MTIPDDFTKIIESLPSEARFDSILPAIVDHLFSMIIPSFLLIALLLAIDYAGRKTSSKALRVAATVSALSAAAGVIFVRAMPGSIAVSYLTLAFAMTVVVRILRFENLAVLDYAVMFACFTCINRFIGLNTWLFGSAFPVFCIFFVLFFIYRLSAGRLEGRLFHAWFASLLTVLEAYLCNALFNHTVLRIGQPLGTSIDKAFVWGLTALAIVLINIVLIYGIKRLFGKRFDEINAMGKAYPRIERYFIYNSVAILLLAMLLNLIYGLANTFINMPTLLFNIFLVFAQVIQFSFLLLVFRITRLQDSLQSKTMENEGLATYTSSLEKNMDDIRGIKHDLKNIFLTMGDYVHRSGNEEMQAFFREKISPFVNDEIEKSDLFSKLASIDDEHLKAIFRYKIAQALERGIGVDLEMQFGRHCANISVEITDLVRVLGILLDNAIEECMALESGLITIRFSENEEMLSIAIMNTVRPGTREAGVRAGVSTKDEGRGRGLRIARAILEKYNCMTLNTYFQEDSVVQCLTIYLVC
ncbi:MAG: GHKL domain-containing protein [Clostridiales bacterium]|nr:GHKL domain-containing protein [Clostridiales bacterium]